MTAAEIVDFHTVSSDVRGELLTKHKFFPTSSSGSESNWFIWQDKDPHFRCFPVKCSGFAENGGTVYVNGAILATLSADFKLRIDRDQEIRFDCSAADFNIAMTLVHSTNRVRPRNLELFTWLPTLHECGLDFVGQVCCWCMDETMFSITQRLQAAVKADNAMLLESTLLKLKTRRELRQITEACGFDPVVRESDEAVTTRHSNSQLLSAALDRHMALLPEEEGQWFAYVPGQWYGNARAITTSILKRTFRRQCGDQTLDFTIPSRLRDFALTVNGTKLFVSHEVIARASRVFYRSIFGDSAELNSMDQALRASVLQLAMDSCLRCMRASADDFKLLLTLVFPTPYGMMWRLTPVAERLREDDWFRRCRLMELYESDTCFNSNSQKFVSVFKLAHHLEICGLVHYLAEVAVECLPWRERLHLADAYKSREIMDSLLSDNDCLMELEREVDTHGAVWESLAMPTKELINEFLAKAAL